MSATLAGLSAEDLGPIGFGSMRLTGSGVWGPPRDLDGAIGLLRRAVEWGVRLIDTADAYGPGHAEELIAAALHPYPAGLTVATKGGFERTPDGGWAPNGRPEYLRAACEASLRRLRVDCIDVYQLHTPDPAVPLVESVGALMRLREAGLIRHIGVSNVTMEQLALARNQAPVAVVQNRLNFADRDSLPLLDVCAAAGIPFLAYTPLNRASPDEALSALGREYGVPAAQMALVWLRALSPAVVPIPGTRRPEHLDQNLAAGDVPVDDALRRRVRGARHSRDSEGAGHPGG
jgi:pyridoxine 4-dehydrogenase